jgi:transcriptional regulator with XRE-family HTH domain
MHIGPRIRQLREEQGLSQTQVEEKSGILRTVLSRIENGHSVPTLETLERIAATLGVPLYRFFYTGKGTPKELEE